MHGEGRLNEFIWKLYSPLIPSVPERHNHQQYRNSNEIDAQVLGHEINKDPVCNKYGPQREGIVVGTILILQYLLQAYLHRIIHKFSTDSPRSFFTSRNRTGRFHVLRCLFAALRMVVVNRCSDLRKVGGDQSLHHACNHRYLSEHLL